EPRIADSACSTSAMNRCPAGVGRTPRPCRSNRIVPSQCSTACTRRLIAPCVTPSASAAAENEPVRQASITAARPSIGGSELCMRRTAQHRSLRYVNDVAAGKVRLPALSALCLMHSRPHARPRGATFLLATLLPASGLHPVAALAGDTAPANDVKEQATDAFGSRIGTESIGLYSESLVRGFDLQQAGNYRLEDAYLVRAAAPPDTLVEGARIRVGPNALDIGFPAPSGIVQYRLLPGDRDRVRVELGFQH